MENGRRAGEACRDRGSGVEEKEEFNLRERRNRNTGNRMRREGCETCGGNITRREQEKRRESSKGRNDGREIARVERKESIHVGG